MNTDKLPDFLCVLIPRILSKLTETKGITEQEAIQILYNSKLYEALEQEETKLWHLSVESLYSILDEEMMTGIITFPEEQ